MAKKIKKYLEYTGFENIKEKPQYKFRLWMDAIFAITYTLVSIILIWMNKADMVVFALNTICLFRALIHNTIKASEITDSRNIDDKHNKYSYYHLKSGMLFVAALLFGIAWFSLSIEHSKNVDGLIKIFATIAILAVCLDDCENIVVYAYGAIIQ